jgi:hypothetical protein
MIGVIALIFVHIHDLHVDNHNRVNVFEWLHPQKLALCFGSYLAV